MMQQVIRHVRGLALLLAFVTLSGWASAEEEESQAPTIPERVDAFEDELKTAERAKDLPTLDRLIEQGKSLLTEVRAARALSERERERAAEDVVDAVGDLADFSEDPIARAAVTALGVMEHEEGFRAIKRHLKPPRDGRPDPIVRDAIVAAGLIADDAAVPLLLKIVDRSDHTATAAEAMRALSHFRHSKRYRKKILLELVSITRKFKPGGPTPSKENKTTGGYIPGKSGTAGGSRWSAFSSALPITLNALTGQNLATATDWFHMVQDNKRNLDDLFVEDE